MDKTDFKFKFRFNSAFEVKKGPEFGKFLSTANLSKLRPLMPAGIDLDNNPDLTGIVLNAAVGNYCNKNGDAIDNKTLVKVAKNFLFKRVDIEHIAVDNIGVIVNYGFSSFDSNELLTEEQVIASQEPVNLSLALILWDTSIDDNLYNLILDSANPESLNYQAISASWEFYYNDYDICVGKSKLVPACKIVVGKEKEKYEDLLPKKGGVGQFDGNYLFRLIKCDENNLLLPAGIGLVMHPAAQVKGLEIVKNHVSASTEVEININPEPESEESDPEKPEESKSESNTMKVKCEKCGSEDMSDHEEEDKICAKCKDKTSVHANFIEKSVINNKNKIYKEKLILISKHMTIQSFKELTDESLKVVTAADIQKVHEQLVAESIKEANEKYEATLNESKVLEAKTKETEDKLNETIKELELLSAKLKEVETKELVRIAEANFTSRMDALDKDFDLSDEVRAVFAKDVRAIDSNESFEAYKNKMSVFLKKKEAKVSTASVKSDENVVTTLISSAETKIEVPNAGSIQTDYKSLVAKAFSSENITITK